MITEEKKNGMPEAAPATGTEGQQADETMVQPAPETVQPTRKPQRMRRILCVIAVVVLLIVAAGDGVQRWRIESMISTAKSKLDLPYVLGAVGPNSYDCSSLVQECAAKGYVTTPRLAIEIGYDTDFQKIESPGKLLRGDIVCWDTIKKDQDASDHVGFYLGGGRVLHASSGQGKVVISDMEGYYIENFSWALRPVRHLPFDIPFLK